jgi:hypothetical protein
MNFGLVLGESVARPERKPFLNGSFDRDGLLPDRLLGQSGR